MRGCAFKVPDIRKLGGQPEQRIALFRHVEIFARARCFVATTALAQENPSAYEALRVVGTQLNRDMVNHVISVTGVDGDPQPRSWKILVADRARDRRCARDRSREDNRIVSERVPNRSVVGSTEGKTINTARLNLDSTGAYPVASHTAETSHVTFRDVSYTLRTDERGNPIWIVTLEDRSQKAGRHHPYQRQRRTVTRVEGMFQGANMEQVERRQTRPIAIVTIDDE